MVSKLFIQSHNIFVGSLQNETNKKFKQSQEVTVKTLQLFLELVFYIHHKHDDSIHIGRNVAVRMKFLVTIQII